ncbi:hypothetical protein FHX44_11834 [Pseudonocardia hierapolitana]|uniref:Uncharacterized protein n=1 Tax=Pseudonocardia hierapolitana TaxID=1128676 RepID=A0A561SJ98_9PSEU|nr:hypothetical protein FHX44_11834 [Pseudonocardia hierapolitana]
MAGARSSGSPSATARTARSGPRSYAASRPAASWGTAGGLRRPHRASSRPSPRCCWARPGSGPHPLRGERHDAPRRVRQRGEPEPGELGDGGWHDGSVPQPGARPPRAPRSGMGRSRRECGAGRSAGHPAARAGRGGRAFGGAARVGCDGVTEPPADPARSAARLPSAEGSWELGRDKAVRYRRVPALLIRGDGYARGHERHDPGNGAGQRSDQPGACPRVAGAARRGPEAAVRPGDVRAHQQRRRRAGRLPASTTWSGADAAEASATGAGSAEAPAARMTLGAPSKSCHANRCPARVPAAL